MPHASAERVETTNPKVAFLVSVLRSCLVSESLLSRLDVSSEARAVVAATVFFFCPP